MITASESRAIVVWEDLFHSRIQADMVFLGSSRTCDHYNTVVFDSILGLSSYNLGLHGKNIDMCFLRYKLLNKYKNNKPKYIVWDIFHDSYNISNGWLDEQFTPYINENEIWREMRKANHDFSIFDRIIPLYRYWKRSYIYDYAFHNPRRDKNPYHGYSPNLNPTDFTKAITLTESSVTCTVERKILSQFSDILKETSDDNITNIIVISPYYQPGLPLIKDFDKIISITDSLAKKNHCIFFNYIDDKMCTDSTLFSNVMHLNSRGADLFSRKLATALDSILYH